MAVWALAASVIIFAASTASIVVLPTQTGPCNSYQTEKSNEGYYKCVHNDSLGIPYIGVGFYLNALDAKSKIESVGGNYSAVLYGKECLNDSQIKMLFDMDMNVSLTCASKWLSNWDQLSGSVQSAIADMAFSMGCTMLHELSDVQNALEHEQYQKAVQALGAYFWCNSQQDRCERDAKCILGN